ncbi:hypothetical protein FHL15_008493 [Xylaria flabelliformis]|uniref:ubiquitinyl hydrolase 1 n=1 Tax=Xylaria flabelliformis TaxID=2512241 RepID=A0A553HRG0_9PEZI|nr:hypothetical protein FHL15_008493 [Xylaria flabelliformis]
MAAIEENHVAVSTANPDDLPIVNGIRRSGRAKRVPLKYDEEVIIPAEKSNQAKTITTKAARPKRSAADAARERMVPEEVAILQEEVFARMDIDERKEYRGWVELESEPAFFNAMLQDLDAKTLTVQEVVALDKTILAELPHMKLARIVQRTFGLTTANACATVALMNIIMNAHGVKFGPELEEFRHTTKPLPPPHRGRNDLLSEDLLLDNKLESASKRRAVPAKKRQKTSNSSPYAPDDTWLNLASEAIQNRMARQDDAYPSFNLLAICQSPLLTFSQSLARNLATAKALDFSDIWKGFPDERLARFGLNREKILAEFSSSSPPNDKPEWTREELRTEIEALEARYVEEEATVHDAVDMIRARQRDYTPAIHQWVRILADKGVLRELIQETDSLG